MRHFAGAPKEVLEGILCADFAHWSLDLIVPETT
jgi:hypothetical protein